MLSSRRLSALVPTLMLGLILAACAGGADWPTYLHDSARSGATTGTLSPALAGVGL